MTISLKTAQARKDAGLCFRCKQPTDTSRNIRCRDCQDYSNASVYEWRRKVKQEVLQGYGCKCVCCGDTRWRYLQLDHVNGNGRAHRRELGNGTEVWRWAIKNKFPATLQLLCANCHFAKTNYGGCSPSEH